jgi:hypothetical protein
MKCEDCKFAEEYGGFLHACTNTKSPYILVSIKDDGCDLGQPKDAKDEEQGR